MSGVPLVPRAATSRALGLTLASRPRGRQALARSEQALASFLRESSRASECVRLAPSVPKAAAVRASRARRRVTAFRALQVARGWRGDARRDTNAGRGTLCPMVVLMSFHARRASELSPDRFVASRPIGRGLRCSRCPLREAWSCAHLLILGGRRAPPPDSPLPARSPLRLGSIVTCCAARVR